MAKYTEGQWLQYSNSDGKTYEKIIEVNCDTYKLYRLKNNDVYCDVSGIVESPIWYKPITPLDAAMSNVSIDDLEESYSKYLKQQEFLRKLDDLAKVPILCLKGLLYVLAILGALVPVLGIIVYCCFSGVHPDSIYGRIDRRLRKLSNSYFNLYILIFTTMYVINLTFLPVLYIIFK